MSQPCRPAEIFVAVEALWFLVPNVPVVSKFPAALLIWEPKKLFTALFGPDNAFNELKFGPNKA